VAITYRIDRELKVVFSSGVGKLTTDDLFDYHRSVWSHADVHGFNELMDISAVQQMESPTPERVRDLAALPSGAGGGRTKFALVVAGDLAFGLARMFQAFSETRPGGTKDVGVFRSVQDALVFLELDPATDARVGAGGGSR
jgi:hypothetical protein